jgi:hypothetical protein
MMVGRMLIAGQGCQERGGNTFRANPQCNRAIACRHETGWNERTQRKRHREQAREPSTLAL